MTPPPANAVLDAPVTTIEYDADESRPLQQIPTTEFKARWEQVALAIFIAVPLLAIAGAGFVLWGHGLSLTDVVLSAVFYAVTLHGITVGFHRYFTHGSFKANRALRIGLKRLLNCLCQVLGQVLYLMMKIWRSRRLILNMR